MNSASPAKWRIVTKCLDRYGLYLYIYDNKRSSQGRRAPHNHTCPPDGINSALRRRDSWCFGHVATRHLPDECFETRLAAQRVEPPVDLDAAVDPGVERREIFVAFFQQAQRFLFLPQREADDGERIGRDITLPGLSR